MPRLRFIFLLVSLNFLVSTALAQSVQAERPFAMQPTTFPTAVPLSETEYQPLPSLADMLVRVNPAVVNIATRSVVRESNRLLEDPFFRRFFNAVSYTHLTLPTILRV